MKAGRYGSRLHGEEPHSGVSNHERSTKDYQFISFVVRVHGLSPVLTMKEMIGTHYEGTLPSFSPFLRGEGARRADEGLNRARPDQVRAGVTEKSQVLPEPKIL
jgi:hypothetical protein